MQCAAVPLLAICFSNAAVNSVEGIDNGTKLDLFTVKSGDRLL